MSNLERAADDFSKVIADLNLRLDPAGLHSVAKQIASTYGVPMEEMLYEFDRLCQLRFACRPSGL